MAAHLAGTRVKYRPPRRIISDSWRGGGRWNYFKGIRKRPFFFFFDRLLFILTPYDYIVIDKYLSKSNTVRLGMASNRIIFSVSRSYGCAALAVFVRFG